MSKKQTNIGTGVGPIQMIEVRDQREWTFYIIDV